MSCFPLGLHHLAVGFLLPTPLCPFQVPCGVFFRAFGYLCRVSGFYGRLLCDFESQTMSSFPQNAKYVVLNENTLGALFGPSNAPWLEVLHGSVLKGGHDWKNGPFPILPTSDTVRVATPLDFSEYRVALPRDYVQANPTEVTTC